LIILAEIFGPHFECMQLILINFVGGDKIFQRGPSISRKSGPVHFLGIHRYTPLHGRHLCSKYDIKEHV